MLTVPQPTLLTGMLIALLPALLPLLMLAGLLQSATSLTRTADLLCGALLLLAALQLLRYSERRQPLLLAQSLLAAILPLLPPSLWPADNASLRVSILGVLLSALLLLALYPRRLSRISTPAPLPAAQGPAAQPGAPTATQTQADSEFLARLSYEMRTPLSGVLGMTELLATTPLSPRQRDYVQTLQGAGNELLQRINELFDIDSLASGTLDLQEVAFDLPALLKVATENFLTISGHARERLELDLDSQLPATCHGDPDRLRQLLHHLLINAHQRSGEHGLLRMRVRHHGGTLELQLCDDGPPLADSERTELEQTPFTRDNYMRARMQNRQATLLLCRQTVSLMTGHFGLEAPQQGGLCIDIRLPLEAATSQKAPLQLRDARVLVVDSNADTRAPLVRLCTSWGMQVSESDSASQTLALLRSHSSLEAPFDLLLIDQDLPDDALQLASRVRADKQLPEDLLLVLCGSDPGIIAARAAGFNRVLGRPLASYTLRATLDEELARLFAARRQSSSKLPKLQLPPDYRILIAEDDGISAKVIRGLLARLNIEPTLVGNGAQALAAMAKQRYDLVLMDCDMPVMDGLMATRHQRERESRESLPRQPIIALSAHVLEAQRSQMIDAGMDGLLPKPVEMLELYRVLEEQRRSPRLN